MNRQEAHLPLSSLLLAAFLPPLVILVLLPIDVFSANRPFMPFPVITHLLFALPATTVVAAVLFTALRLSPALPARVATALLVATGITAWVLATFIQEGGHVLMGRQFLAPLQDQSPSAPYYATAIASLGAFTWLGMARPAIVQRLASALATLLVVLAAYSILTDSKRMPDVLGTERVSQFSETQPNVVVILLDALQNDLARSILQGDPGLAANLDGFVFHENAMSVAPSTYGSIPAIHSGVTLQGIPSISDAYTRGIEEHSFLVDLARHGYATSVINPMHGVCPNDSAFCSSTFVTVDGFFASTLSQALYLVDLTLFRIAPRELRFELYDGGEWLLSGLTSPGGFAQHAAATIRQVTNRMTLDSMSPTAKFLHLFVAHPPFTVDADCDHTGALDYSPEGAKASAHCALRHVAAVVQNLKTRGIYDNTLLVIVSDHGLGIVTDREGRMTYEWADAFGRMVALASATIMVKPFNASGALQYSQDPVSISDVKQIVCSQAGTCGSTRGTLPVGGDGHGRTRRFSDYQWEHQFWLMDQVPSVRHFIVRGDYRQPWSWMPVKGPEAFDANQLSFSEKDPEAVFGSGWGPFQSSGEHSWRCVIGKMAQLYLSLPSYGSPTASFYLKNHPLNKDQVATVRMNGTPIATFRPLAEGSSHSIRIPEGMRERSPAVLTFSFSEAHAPPGDPISISACFFSLRIQNGN